ncbi:MAG: methyltransferase domain-containing protein [Rhodospirillales bacterium]|nr:MAG: methyltransferase domain-containing protein [Rhodospirillales bacterium]
MNQPEPLATVFDSRLVRAHRERAAPGLADHDFLFREVAERLADRLLDINRSFPLALDLGCHCGEFAALVGGRGGIETLIQCDPAPAMARRAGGLAVAAEADALPFRDGIFDLIVSILSLHWVNDLPGALVQIRRLLKPDGLFLTALPGGGTLGELRAALTAAELEIAGGVSPRIAPFVDLRDAGALLQRAGFALPVADSDTITVRYENPFRLMADLRGMGETAAMRGMPRHFTRRDVILRAAETYRQHHEGADGRIPATFQIVWLTGWAPDPSQQKPARPGSATARLADILRAEAGDRDEED